MAEQSSKGSVFHSCLPQLALELIDFLICLSPLMEKNKQGCRLVGIDKQLQGVKDYQKGKLGFKW